MASQLLGIKTRFTNDLGSPLVGGQVYTYFAGTSTNQDSYSDAALTVPNTNPVILDDTGSADIFLKGAYRIRVFDKSGRFIEEQDNVTQAASQGDATELASKVSAVESDLVTVNTEIGKVKLDTGITAIAKLNGITRRQYDINAETINVKDFGAVGDGVTDDSDAFQSAIIAVAALANSFNRRVLFIPVGIYKITKKLYVWDTSHFTIKGVTCEGIGGSTIHFYHPLDASIDCLFDVAIQNFSFYDVTVWQVANADYTELPPVTCIKVKRPVGSPSDVDTYIGTSKFKQFSVGIYNSGRGLHSDRNTYAECGNPIELDYPNPEDYQNSTEGIKKDLTGYRAIVVNDNRFHSIGTVGIKNTGANAHKIQAIQISRVLMDIGRRVFEGVLANGSINGVVCTMTPIKMLVLTDGSKNYSVSNIVSTGSSVAGRVPDYFIELSGTHHNGSFNNIVVDNCTNDAIRVSADSSLKGISFNGIVCGNVGAGSRVIRVLDGAHDISINGLTYTGTTVLSEAVRAEGAAKVKVRGYSSVNGTPLTVSGVDSSSDIGVNSSNELVRFKSSSSDATLGKITYENAGTNGITVESKGSINLNPDNNTVRPFTDNVVSLGASSRKFTGLWLADTVTGTPYQVKVTNGVLTIA